MSLKGVYCYILHHTPYTNIHYTSYLGIRLLLNLLTACLGGGYVPFGVLSLYQDVSLQNALDLSLQIVLQIPM
ncbi:hypothetical protein EON63_13390 [archaeon]|nr:MAG: hypothetical protein EON63_13390 [archaeon]